MEGYKDTLLPPIKTPFPLIHDPDKNTCSEIPPPQTQTATKSSQASASEMAPYLPTRAKTIPDYPL